MSSNQPGMEMKMMDETSLVPDSGQLTFSAGSEKIVVFHADGTMWVNPKLTADEAARKFWEVLAPMVMQTWAQQQAQTPSSST